MNNNLKKVVSKNIDTRDRNTTQIVEITTAQAEALNHFPKNTYIRLRDEGLPVIADDLTIDSTTGEIAEKINSIIQALDGWILRRS